MFHKILKATLAGILGLHLGGALVLAPLLFSLRFWTPRLPPSWCIGLCFTGIRYSLFDQCR
jgi:hypothetical protein